MKNEPVTQFLLRASRVRVRAEGTLVDREYDTGKKMIFIELVLPNLDSVMKVAKNLESGIMHWHIPLSKLTKQDYEK